ncbi:MAG TPA: hypothetical protein VG013_39740 [Gemmataceae bacterium]|jgi:hypothetical protein|nr:hypothetical protein [Gemmataceae bacterium]
MNHRFLLCLPLGLRAASACVGGIDTGRHTMGVRYKDHGQFLGEWYIASSQITSTGVQKTGLQPWTGVDTLIEGVFPRSADRFPPFAHTLQGGVAGLGCGRDQS